jgi:hypothetical protein
MGNCTMLSSGVGPGRETICSRYGRASVAGFGGQVQILSCFVLLCIFAAWSPYYVRLNSFQLHAVFILLLLSSYFVSCFFLDIHEAGHCLIGSQIPCSIAASVCKLFVLFDWFCFVCEVSDRSASIFLSNVRAKFKFGRLSCCFLRY